MAKKKKTKKFSAYQKAQLARLISEQEVSPADLEQRFGVTAEELGNWQKKYLEGGQGKLRTRFNQFLSFAIDVASAFTGIFSGSYVGVNLLAVGYCAAVGLPF